jgi:hypothetical protein
VGKVRSVRRFAPGLEQQSGGSVTIRGCVSKSNGDYVLLKENPGITYQRQGGKIRLKSYLGKRVEITGTESPTLSTSEDAINSWEMPVRSPLQSNQFKPSEESAKAVSQAGFGSGGELAS